MTGSPLEAFQIMAAPDLEKTLPAFKAEDKQDPVNERHSRRRSHVALYLFIAILGLLVFATRTLCQQWQSVPVAAPVQYGMLREGAGLVVPDDNYQPDGLTPEATEDGTLSLKRQASTASTPAPSATVLECFQVAQPVLTPHGASYQSTNSDGSTVVVDAPDSEARKGSCTVLLMEHVFAWSYGMPFIGKVLSALNMSIEDPLIGTSILGNYTPPSCEFNRVVMNFTVVSQGRQFDRLALMYMGDTEVWRTSTAEPTQPPGIRWVYMKDMTEYLYFWKQPQKIIFDLGNLIDDKYTGSFNTTLTATFFKADVDTGAAPPSDLIIPISARKGSADAVSQFTLPQDNATNTISFPQNANRAVFSVSANGQASEEFWWSNVLQSDVYAFNSTAGAFPGYSPFREVQVFIDGQLAGVQWPFPVIFTGGVVPSLHRPIVGIDAFDLREHEIDITAWLPYLSDGAEHTFSINVVGLDDDGSTGAAITSPVGSSWYVTGKIFVWLDDEDSVTTGDVPTIQASAPTITVSQSATQNSTGANETLTYDTAVQRTFSVSAKVVSQKSSEVVSWSQTLSYSNKGYVSAFGYDQINDFLISGSDVLSGPVTYKTNYKYPLWCNSSYSQTEQGNLTIHARLIQGLDLQVQGAAVFPTGLEAFAAGVRRTAGRKFKGGSLLSTSRDGTAAFFQTGDGKNSSGYGTTNQVFHFGGVSGAGTLGSAPDVELYFRNVTAVNGTVVYDDEKVADVHTAGYHGKTGPAMGNFKGLYAQAPVDGQGPRAFMGRQDAIGDQ